LNITYNTSNRNRDDLLLKLKSNPLPFEQPKSASYPGMEEDLKELEEDNLVLIIKKKDPMVIYYLCPEAGSTVDTDIQDLWNSATNKNIVSTTTTNKRLKHSHQ